MGEISMQNWDLSTESSACVDRDTLNEGKQKSWLDETLTDDTRCTALDTMYRKTLQKQTIFTSP